MSDQSATLAQINKLLQGLQGTGGGQNPGSGQSSSSGQSSGGAFDDYYRQLYFDTLLHDATTLEFAIRQVGADRLVLGTDYPADMGNWGQVALVEALAFITPEQKADILHNNAARLLGLPL